jgi:hypothetical protein
MIELSELKPTSLWDIEYFDSVAIPAIYEHILRRNVYTADLNHYVLQFQAFAAIILKDRKDKEYVLNWSRSLIDATTFYKR